MTDPSDQNFPFQCSNCGTTWKVTPATNYDEHDLETYPRNDFCPHCAAGSYSFESPEEEEASEDPDRDEGIELYTPYE